MFKGEETDVVGALDRLDANVRTQLAEVERAWAELASAKAGVKRADASLASGAYPRPEPQPGAVPWTAGCAPSAAPTPSDPTQARTGSGNRA